MAHPQDQLPPLRLKGLGVIGLLRLFSALMLLLPVLPLSLYWLASHLDGLPFSLEWLLIICLALAVVFSAIIGHTIARTILDPLRLLVQGAEKIQDGEYGHIIDPAATRDAPMEFKQLVRAFNRMSTTLLEHIQTIQTTSRTDQLTGMYNRRHLMAEGYRLLGVAIRAGKPCSCLMIDIDHFKNVNDTYGHPVGDKYLVHIAGCITSAIRESDMAARYGGEEFLVLAPNASLQEARTLAERIRQAVAAAPLKLGQVTLNNTVSIGVSEYSEEPQFGASVLEDMIEKADKALYRAKLCGRNRVMTWPLPEDPPGCS
ncbi:MAG: sensor domain-containing diguanylate cyclase [Desulfovibrio sp.]|nr:sensor domain-containing diguanylate cyclase [Desulfovibrio sp.]